MLTKQAAIHIIKYQISLRLNIVIDDSTAYKDDGMQTAEYMRKTCENMERSNLDTDTNSIAFNKSDSLCVQNMNR